MPSPFPGMDPYLEGSDWRSVHTHLNVEYDAFRYDLELDHTKAPGIPLQGDDAEWALELLRSRKSG